MVSYMYQYEKGTKKKNVGYVRVETRNGECKFTIHMQLLGIMDSIFPTYMIQKNKKETDLIYLGDSVLRNQVIDSKMVTRDNNIGGSGYRLSEFRGMVLFYNDEVFFATEWTDQPFLIEELLIGLTRKHHHKFSDQTKVLNQQKVVQREPRLYNYNRYQRRDEIGKIRGMSAVESIEAAKKVYQRPRGWKVIEAIKEEPLIEKRSSLPEEAPTLNQPRFRITRHMKPTKEDRMKTHAAQVVNTAPKLDWEIEDEIPWFGQDTMNQNGMKVIKDILKDHDHKGDVIENKKEETAYEDKVNQIEEAPYEGTVNQIEEARYEDTVNQIEEARCEDKVNQIEEATHENVANVIEDATEEEYPKSSLVDKLFTHYPKFYPFEDKNVISCVKIEPKDIHLFPLETRVLTNNSFLMHGYYCYNHLIFAKIKDRGGHKYIIGVPGIYHNKERFLAKMFGFEYFKSVKKRELRAGDFGYWFIPILL